MKKKKAARDHLLNVSITEWDERGITFNASLFGLSPFITSP